MARSSSSGNVPPLGSVHKQRRSQVWAQISRETRPRCASRPSRQWAISIDKDDRWGREKGTGVFCARPFGQPSRRIELRNARTALAQLSRLSTRCDREAHADPPLPISLPKCVAARAVPSFRAARTGCQGSRKTKMRVSASAGSLSVLPGRPSKSVNVISRGSPPYTTLGS